MTDADAGPDDARTTPDESPAIPRLATMTAFQRDALWALAHGAPMKGITLKRTIEEYYEEPVNHSRVYTNLDDLVDWGLVDKSKRDERTNEYRLTTDGRRALSRRRAWVDVGEPSEE